jgi:hypothetical protein
VSFFEPIPTPTPEPKPEARRHPPWVTPPANELGVAVPFRLILAKTDTLALAVTDVVAYSTGFALSLAFKLHHDAEDINPHQVAMQFRGDTMAGADERLRFGIGFSDGRKATNLGPFRPFGEPPLISLGMCGGGGGNGQGWAYSYFVYPLPPPGPITLAIAWPSFDLPEDSVQFDAAPIIDASAQVEQFWEDNRPFYGEE